jgi:hypothetical protein
MSRYLVERVFPERWVISLTDAGTAICQEVVARNADLGVTWIHSYVGEVRKTSFCVYDGPTPEAIRRAAKRNGLPVDRIIQVTVLDPYFYR